MQSSQQVTQAVPAVQAFSVSFFDVITTIGVVSLIAGFIYIGRKLQVLDGLVKTSEKIKTNVKVVCDFLIKNQGGFNHTELQAYSPVQLTDAGKKFVETIGFLSAFNDHRDDFFSFIDSEHPKVKYDVETSATKSIYALYDREYMNFLKQFFYNNPTRNLPNTAQTLGTHVRDEYLKAHPEITQ